MRTVVLPCRRPWCSRKDIRPSRTSRCEVRARWDDAATVALACSLALWPLFMLCVLLEKLGIWLSRAAMNWVC